MSSEQKDSKEAVAVLAKLHSMDETTFGRLLKWDWIEIELSRQQVMFVGRDKDGKPMRCKQITIRNIDIKQAIHRKRGILRALVRDILQQTGAVVLEAVQNDGLLQRLEKSTLWQCTTPFCKGEVGSSYARVGLNDPFVLF